MMASDPAVLVYTSGTTGMYIQTYTVKPVLSGHSIIDKTKV